MNFCLAEVNNVSMYHSINVSYVTMYQCIIVSMYHMYQCIIAITGVFSFIHDYLATILQFLKFYFLC